MESYKSNKHFFLGNFCLLSFFRSDKSSFSFFSSHIHFNDERKRLRDLKYLGHDYVVIKWEN